jgi:dTMP kinase
MLLAGYGTAPIAAVIFTALSLLASAITAVAPSFEGNSVDIALYLNGLSFLFAAVTIWGLKEIPSNKGDGKNDDE